MTLRAIFAFLNKKIADNVKTTGQTVVQFYVLMYLSRFYDLLQGQGGGGSQICTILSRYCTAYSSRMFIMLPPANLLTYLQKWRQVLFNSVDGRSVVVST